MATKSGGKVTLGSMNNVMCEYSLGFVRESTIVCCKPFELGTSTESCKGFPEAIAANILLIFSPSNSVLFSYFTNFIISMHIPNTVSTYILSMKRRSLLYPYISLSIFASYIFLLERSAGFFKTIVSVVIKYN